MNLEIDKPLRAAVIGCGRMGAQTTERTRKLVPPIWMPLSHTDAITSIDNMELVAVCDISADHAGRTANAYPGSTAYTDHLKMLEDVRPDIVGIATRTVGRCEIIRDCTEFGVRGIHSEKPLARSITEARVALDAMRTHNIGFTFGAIRRYMAPYKLAKDLVAAGEIGELRQIVIDHGADMLLWGHPHSVDLASYFCSGHRVARVQARLRIDPQAVSDHVLDCDPQLDMAYMEFDHGISAVITSGIGKSVRLLGTNGSIVVRGSGLAVELRKKEAGRSYESEPRNLPFDDTISGTQQAFMNLSAFITEGKLTDPTFEEVEQIHRVLFAMALSELDAGRAIDPAEVPDSFFVTGRFGDLTA